MWDTTQAVAENRAKDAVAVVVTTADKDVDTVAVERQCILRIIFGIRSKREDAEPSKHLGDYQWQEVTRQQQGRLHTQTL